ncbi:MAG: hypothetical protein KAG56_05035 [Sulfurovaceae bacterium]|nr:hypothetical protein [Sulfurovaceae bacterium]
MIFKKIVKFIPALIYSLVVLGIFYWQFNSVYSSIIENFKDEKLSTLHTYLFLYLFSIYILTITLINLVDYFILKNRLFVQITSFTLLLFYGFSFQEFYHLIEYFIDYPLSQNNIMGILFFVLLSFGYSLYSIIALFFKEHIPLSHTLVFLLLGMSYALYFMHHYGKPLSEIMP